MQLAASQRPHPPPVPPRPSRQVVAEALKRSPRPPCPTRQAPPPPNTKPWRSGEQEIPGKTAGRTVVYESSKELAEEEKERVEENEGKEKLEGPKVEGEGESKPVSRSDSRRQVTNLNSKLPKIEKESNFETEPKVETQPKALTKSNSKIELPKESKPLARSDFRSQATKLISENPKDSDPKSQLTNLSRNEIESNFERVSEVLTRSESENQDSEVKERSIETPRQSRRPSVESLLENEIYELVEECRLKNLEKHGQDAKEIRLGDIHLDPSRPRLRSQKMSFDARERAKNKNKDEVVLPQRPEGEKLRPLKCPKPQERRSLRPPVPARNNIVQSEERRESKAGKLKFGEEARVAGRPTLPSKPRQRLDSSSSNGAMTNNRTGSENKSILSDDGATVVIVDEPEKKAVAFNEDGDNIHHQDWLEAGVRYSSTQITLSGDEASDRVNGFAHLEDEVEFGDLDFSRYRLRE